MPLLSGGERVLRHLFLLDPDVVFLNHGSFGACPEPVFETYQRLQLEVERRPIELLSRDRQYPELIEGARARLAAYVGAEPSNLVFATNATEALNAVARSLPLREGDEVLAPVGEYQAVDMLWRFVCARAGAHYVRRPLRLGCDPAEALEELWRGVTARTRVVAASHVSCVTGVVFPVDELCRRCREHDVLSVVDGAHAPGQIPLELESLAADFYAGNCHKWLCAPKGSGFLYVRPEQHELIEPTVVSWDWEEETAFTGRRRWQGTRDVAAWLTVPAAIDFQVAHDWSSVSVRCHELAAEARTRLAELFETRPLTPSEDSFVQLVGVALPPVDAKALQRRLLAEHRIEVLCQAFEGLPVMRLSFQAYNERADLDRLVEALRTLLS